MPKKGRSKGERQRRMQMRICKQESRELNLQQGCGEEATESYSGKEETSLLQTCNQDLTEEIIEEDQDPNNLNTVDEKEMLENSDIRNAEEEELSLIGLYFKDQSKKLEDWREHTQITRNIDDLTDDIPPTQECVRKRLKRMNPEYRLHEQQKDTAARKKRREDIEVRKKEQQKDTSSRQEKRKVVEFRQKEQQKDASSRQEKRKLVEFRQKEQQKDTASRQEKRKVVEFRQKEQQKDTASRQEKRKVVEFRQKEQQKDTASRQEKRNVVEFRQKEQQKNTAFRIEKRKVVEFRQKEQQKDTTSRQEKRKVVEFRQKEQQKDTASRQEKRKVVEFRQKEQQKNTAFRIEKRKVVEIRQKEQQKDTASRIEKRKVVEIRQKEQLKDTASRKERRGYILERQKEQLKDKRRRRESRKDPEIRQRERSIDNTNKQKSRSLSGDITNAVAAFKTKILQGPSYICTSCNRLLFKRSLYKFNPNSYNHIDQNLLSECRTSKMSFDGQEYICITCRNSLQKGTMPNISVANGFKLDDIPYQLHDLNTLEVVFISRRIPFMKLLALPRGKQRSVHGCVVNVPIEPEQSLSVLPRAPSSDAFITVKLKRKLQYRGHVFLQNIRPQKIQEALYLLKHDLKNPLYSDVTLNEEWASESQQSDINLWNTLTGRSGEDGDDLTDENENDTEEPEKEDERSRLSGMPFDTCIQPKDIANNKLLLSFAPGENKLPKSYHTDEHSEELSFPQLFPSGQFGFSMQRQKPISLKKYFQTRVLNCDTRFANSIEYLFYAQYRCEVKEVQDCLSIALRKGQNKDLTAGEIRDGLTNFIRNDLGVHFMQKIRGSPAYFNKLFYDLLGMIRHLGPCTWFITLSAADLKWPDTIQIIAQQQGITLSSEEIDALTWEERCSYLRSNPVTPAIHFDNRVKLFMKYILLNKNLNPLGNIIDYKHRIEFQHRGSPHVHMLAWAKDAPTFENSSIETLEDFVNNHVTCEIPSDDEKLAELVALVQRHTHSIACKKHGQTCRFQFPRPPLKSTQIFKPLENAPSKDIQQMYSDNLSSVYQQLEASTSWDSVDQLLDAANVTEKQYIDALHWIKTKSGQPAVLLKRTPSEAYVNNYNRTLMSAWEANLDVQFVTNVYSCVMYLASYVSKPEKTLGDVLKAVSSSSQHLGTKTSMRSVAQKFLTHREVSAQEAVYRLMSLPLSQGSREVVFVDTDFAENRTRLFKPMKVLQTLEDDDPDVFQHGMLDKYPARPDKLYNMCLSEFVSLYKTSSRKYDDATVTEDSEEILDNPMNCDNITLKNGMGYMIKRQKPAVVRYHQWSLKKQPEQYFHAQLLLYYPWRNESQDLQCENYRENYISKLETIQNNKKSFEHFTEEVDGALQDMEEFGVNEDSWQTVAPESEQSRIEEEIEGPHEEESVTNVFDYSNLQSNAVRSDTNSTSFSYDIIPEQVPRQEWMEMVLSLNEKQYEIHKNVVDWATKMTMTHRIQKPNPFYTFLTGGAGVGKSHLVRTIVQTVNRIFAINNQADEAHVLVCAPTGAAAYNIAGYTCHAAFLLPIHQRKSDDYIPLSSEKLAMMKGTFSTVKLIVIDEISMVGADTLLTIHRRLCDITGNSEPFGGISILAVGDLLQLPPVAQKAVFAVPSDEMAAIYGSLWKTHFKIAELL